MRAKVPATSARCFVVGAARLGARGYIAVSGGVDVPPVTARVRRFTWPGSAVWAAMQTACADRARGGNAGLSRATRVSPTYHGRPLLADRGGARPKRRLDRRCRL